MCFGGKSDTPLPAPPPAPPPVLEQAAPDAAKKQSNEQRRAKGTKTFRTSDLSIGGGRTGSNTRSGALNI